jgi:hypothetical protein
MANVMTGRMKSLGVSLEAGELRDLRALAHGDGRSISWLLRSAVQDYLSKRKDDVRRYEAQRVMEYLEKQSERLRAEQMDEQLAQVVAKQAAAAGYDPAVIAPANIKAAIAAVGTEQEQVQDEAPRAKEVAKQVAVKPRAGLSPPTREEQQKYNLERIAQLEAKASRKRAAQQVKTAGVDPASLPEPKK